MDNKELDQFAKSLAAAFAGSQVEEKGLSKAEASELLKTTAGDMSDGTAPARAEFMSSRAELLLPLIETQSTVRKIFTPITLGAGQQANFPVSFDTTEFAGYMAKEGGAFVQVVEGDEIYVPTFGIQAGGRWNIDLAKDGRIDVVNQVMRQVASKVTAKEEYAGWRAIKGALSGVNTSQTVYCSGTTENFHAFSKKAIVQMKVRMDIQRRLLTDVFVSPQSLGDVLQWGQNSIDYLTAREIYTNGGLPGGGNVLDGRNDEGGTLWGIKFHKVYDSTLVSDAQAFGFDTRTFGKMPIRDGLTTYDDPMAIYDWQNGVLARERVGFLVTDSWAIVAASLDSTHTGAACSAL